MQERHYFVYIMASNSRAIYTGVTSQLIARSTAHREGRLPGFTQKYKCTKLVYFEHFTEIGNAFAREKQVKGYRREKKIALIEKHNANWEDMSERIPKILNDL